MDYKNRFTTAQVIVTLVMIPVSIIYDGWILMTMWRWFITPLGVAGLSLLQAGGLSLMLAAIKPKTSSEITRDNYWEKLVESIVRPLIALILAWYVHSLMI